MMLDIDVARLANQ